MIDATSLKIDGIASQIKMLCTEMTQVAFAVEANTTALALQAKSFDTMATAFHDLFVELTAETEQDNKLEDLLENILHTLKGLPEAVAKIVTTGECA